MTPILPALMLLLSPRVITSDGIVGAAYCAGKAYPKAIQDEAKFK